MNQLFENYRSLFPVLSTHILLTSCSQSALANPVSKAIEDYTNSLLLSGTNWNEAMMKTEETRVKFAECMGADPEEIAILSSVSEAVSAIAASLSPEHGRDQIVFTDIDFPSMGPIWSVQKPFKKKLIRSSEGNIYLDQYIEEITCDTLLTCIPHVNYSNGFKQNLKEIANIAHQKGSLLLVDSYQSAGHIPINVRELDVDILVTGTRKYMLGIPGVAFLYVKKELAEQLQPRITGWFGQDQASAFDIYHSVLASGARRFETGTPSFISIYAACEALKLLLEIGISPICFYLEKLSQHALNYGLERGLKTASPLSPEERSGMVAFKAEHASYVEQELRKRNIMVSARGSVIRIAPHFYNTREEIEYAIDEILALIKT